MPFQPVPDVASFRIVQGTTTGVDILNTFYVRDTVLAWSSSELEETAIVIGDIWRDDVMPLLSASSTFDRVEAKDESTEFGNEFTAEYNTVGGQALLPLSAALCMQVILRGDGGAAPRLGRLFVSPFTETQLAVDVWDATAAGDLQVAIQNIRDGITSMIDPRAQVIVSRHNKALFPDVPVGSNPTHKRDEAVSNTLSSIEVPTTLAMQRDRRTGIGS